MLAFNLYCYIEFCIFNRVETIEELIFVKLNLEQTSNTFWRYKLGEVTSGTFSPSLKHGIALARVETTVKLGDKLIIDVRGNKVDGLMPVIVLDFGGNPSSVQIRNW